MAHTQARTLAHVERFDGRLWKKAHGVSADLNKMGN